MEKRLIPFLVLLGFLIGCSQADPVVNRANLGPDSAKAVQYASNFRIKESSDYTRVRVIDPWPDSGLDFEYVLVPRSSSLPEGFSEDQVIRTPVERVVVTSTSHIPLLEYLNSAEALVAFPNTDFISSSTVRSLIAQGKITDLGPLAGINVEALLEIAPDLIMGYGSGREYETFQRMSDLGLPVVMNGDYMERSALGRAEWIKFAGIFLGKMDLADSIFRSIENNYDSLRQLVDGVNKRPTVFSGIMYGDTWFMPGGSNFAAQFIEHAGGKYLWRESEDHGWLELSFESVYDKAHDAGMWIGAGSFASLTEIGNSDHRYASFNAFERGEVYNYTARIGPTGGYEFLELGYLRPDMVLADLIYIMHPKLLPGYELYFYEKLQ